MNLVLLLLVFGSTHIWAENLPAINSSCSGLILGPVATTSFQQEILAASLRDSNASDRPAAKGSSLELRLWMPRFDNSWNTVASAGTDVFSLGSGPDIFMPLYGFPLANHYHLVDLLGSWGRGPEEVFSEVEHRLRAIASDAEVTLIHSGFLRFRPPPTLSRILNLDGQPQSVGPWRPIRRSGEWAWEFYQKPCTWKVRWRSKALGFQTRYFSLHVMDYNRPEYAPNLLKSIGKNGIGGILLSGAGLPKREALITWLSAVNTDGFFLAELDYRNASGESSEDIRNFESRDWLNSQFDIIKSHTLPEAEIKNLEGFIPTTYLFRKRHDALRVKH